MYVFWRKNRVINGLLFLVSLKKGFYVRTLRLFILALIVDKEEADFFFKKTWMLLSDKLWVTSPLLFNTLLLLFPYLPEAGTASSQKLRVMFKRQTIRWPKHLYYNIAHMDSWS